jgi:hypothetical protein
MGLSARAGRSIPSASNMTGPVASGILATAAPSDLASQTSFARRMATSTPSVLARIESGVPFTFQSSGSRVLSCHLTNVSDNWK